MNAVTSGNLIISSDLNISEIQKFDMRIEKTEAFQKAVKAENFTAFFGRYQGEGEILWRMKER